MSGSRVTGIQSMEGTCGVTDTGLVLRIEAPTGPLRTIQVAAITQGGGKAAAKPLGTAIEKTGSGTRTIATTTAAN